MIRVLLADDQALVRSGFRVLLQLAGDIDVVGEAGDGRQAIDLARQLHPDVVLMDIRMPMLDGLAATRAISSDADLTGVRILILTTFDEDSYVFQALRAGAAGFLVKDADTDELLHAIRVVAGGQALLTPGATRALIEAYVARPEPATPPTSDTVLRVLTDREREVLALIGVGLSNDEIAAKLVLSPATARTHVSRIMTKLGARDRAQLVVTAYESGLVHPGQH
ncbi:response regulator transcription factor [Dactylosporangium sp. McL0621]|uniref:response regulator transcription factor n=1 Tax=Dactylosporangium sp. McL0621 TaxID=3415678 RepID=UPI003CFB0C6F